jgi:uncharacterized protein DUF4397
MKSTRAISAISLGAAAILVVACSSDVTQPKLATNPPLAYTRFINAVNDTGPLDFRFVDQVDNSPIGLLLAYRSFTPYQATDATHARHMRVFWDIQATGGVAGVVTTGQLADTTVSFTASTYYTIILTGPGASPHWIVLKDNVGDYTEDPAKYQLRVVNLDTAAMDVFKARKSSDPLPASAQWSAVAIGTATAYSSFALDTVDLRSTVTGQVTPIRADVAGPLGSPADRLNNLTAIGGTMIGGSAVSAFAFGPSSPASAAVAKFTTHGIVYVIDHHPKPTF